MQATSRESLARLEDLVDEVLQSDEVLEPGGGGGGGSSGEGAAPARRRPGTGRRSGSVPAPSSEQEGAAPAAEGRTAAASGSDEPREGRFAATRAAVSRLLGGSDDDPPSAGQPSGTGAVQEDGPRRDGQDVAGRDVAGQGVAGQDVRGAPSPPPGTGQVTGDVARTGAAPSGAEEAADAAGGAGPAGGTDGPGSRGVEQSAADAPGATVAGRDDSAPDDDVSDDDVSDGLADDLWAVVDLLDGSAALRRALSDPASEPDAKGDLARRLLADRVGDGALQVVEAAVRLRWSQAADLGDALERCASAAVLASAEREDALGDVEDDLFRFSRLLAREPALANALADRRLPQENRVGLVRSLLEDKVRSQSLRLAVRATAASRGTLVQGALERLVQQAAERRERLLAVVRVPLPLSDEQRSRLADAVQRLYGRAVRLQEDVDPSVEGGASLRVGDEVLDGTVGRRLSDAETALGRRT